MKCVIFFALLGFAMVAARVIPHENQMLYLQQSPYMVLRPRRAPVHRTMLVTGYYGHPINRRSGYVPESAMSAFASGDAVSAGSYLGGPCVSCPEYVNLASNPQSEFVGGSEYGSQAPVELEIPEEAAPTAADPVSGGDATSTAIANSGQDETSPVVPLGSEAAASDDQEEQANPEKPLPPKRKAKKPRKPVVLSEEEDEAEEDEEDVPNWPFPAGSRKQNGPGYNTFFPIMFNGYPGAGFRGGDSGSQPGVATAIANSFSTGKGGSATSHAIAYGGPHPRNKKRSSEDS